MKKEDTKKKKSKQSYILKEMEIKDWQKRFDEAGDIEPGELAKMLFIVYRQAKKKEKKEDMEIIKRIHIDILTLNKLIDFYERNKPEDNKYKRHLRDSKKGTG